ncbi:MAG: thymidylate synthase [Ghiorsea sp.]
MKQYLNLVTDVLENGELKHNRTGIDTLAVFGRQLRFNMADGFPLMTTKKVSFKNVATELLWFISGDTNIKYLNDNNNNIWNDWADENGDLGVLYGSLWRNFDGVDQLQDIIDTLKTDPDSRRMVMSCWSPRHLPESCKTFAENVANGRQALACCHHTVTFVHNNGKLNLKFDMRSNDLGLGLSYNIAFYALLLHMVCQLTDLIPNDLLYTSADAHIYVNHIDALKEQLNRNTLQLSELNFTRKHKNIDDFDLSSFDLQYYICHERLKMPIAV